MRLVMYALCLAVAAGATRADEKPKTSPDLTDPKVILQKTIDALGKVQIASYELEYAVSGWFTMFFPSLSGTVVVGKDTEQKAERFRATLSLRPSNAPEPVPVSAGADGNIYYVIDEKSKTVYADVDPAVLGGNRWSVQFSIAREYGERAPFEEVPKSGEVRLEPSEKVDDQDCYGLRIKSPSQPEAVWFVAKSDFLPRRTRYSAKNDKGEEASSEMTLHKLAVNPSFVKNPFELTVPEGYRKTDDFAP